MFPVGQKVTFVFHMTHIDYFSQFGKYISNNETNPFGVVITPNYIDN